MSRQVSPFASLSGADKQIRWMEYQSIRLPYIQTEPDKPIEKAICKAEDEKNENLQKVPVALERPQPPPEIPRSMPSDFSKTRHTQYDAVIARLKQAELQAQRYMSQASQ